MHYLEENYPAQRALGDHKIGVLITRLCRDFLRDFFSNVFAVLLRGGFSFNERQTTQSAIGFPFKMCRGSPRCDRAERMHTTFFSSKYPSLFRRFYVLLLSTTTLLLSTMWLSGGSNREGLVKIQGLSREDQLQVACKKTTVPGCN